MAYRYVIVRQQPSLYRSEAENFAVLVEGQVPAGHVVFAVGRSPEPKGAVSDVGKAISSKMPELFADFLTAATNATRPGEDVFDSLAQHMKWNFQVSRPEHLDDDDPIHQVAFKLFGEHVAGGDRLVDMLQTASNRQLRVPEPKERVGETFQTAVAIPEPMPFAAD